MKIFSSFLILSLFFIKVQAAPIEVHKLENLTKVRFVQLLKEALENDAKGVILDFDEETTFPLCVRCLGGVLSFQPDGSLGDFIVKKPFFLFVKYPEGDDLTPEDYTIENMNLIVEKCEFLFSQDKEKWKHFSEFFHGLITATLFGDEDDAKTRAQIIFDLEFHP